MVFSLTWLPEVLEAAGLKVAETENWRTRGRAEMGRVRGVMCHHTATRGHLDKNMPTLDLLIRGRADLAGPLAQLGLGRDGTFYVIAAGRANHAGAGRWEGVDTGNSSFIGIEAENDGLSADNWPAVQVDAYKRGVAAILRKINVQANMCCGHKEFALPRGRKPDPSLDMAAFRSDVAALLAGETPAPPIPIRDEAERPTLRRGARGAFVRQMQTLLGVKDDGVFGPNTEAALRAFQRNKNLVPDGITGPKTWAALTGGDAPKTPAPAPTAGQASAAPAAGSPEAVFKRKAPGIMRKLIEEFGFTQGQAAGILGNIGHECLGFTQMQEIKPVGGGRGGFGWCQWTGPRRRDFEAFCAERQLDIAGDEGNLAFLIHELKTSEKRTVPALKKAATVEEAVLIFLQKFERAGVAHEKARNLWANRAMDAFA